MALGSSFLSNNLLTTPKGVLGPRIWGSLCWIAVQTTSNRSLRTEWLFMKGHFSAGVAQRRWYAAGSRARRSFPPISIYLLAIPPILLRSYRFKNEICIINKRQQLFFYSHLAHAYHSWHKRINASLCLCVILIVRCFLCTLICRRCWSLLITSQCCCLLTRQQTHSCAINGTGTFCWGSNSNGQVFAATFSSSASWTSNILYSLAPSVL